MTLPTLLLATNNAHKVRELRALFVDCGWTLTTPRELGIDLDPAETGSTYTENARLKAEAFARESGQWSLADDSGLEVDALDGAPGIHSARYAGADTPHEEKIRVLLGELGAVPLERRGARFRAVFVLISPDGRSWESEGVWQGRIADAPRGAEGFGYDPVFVPDGGNRTSGELSSDEKNRDSHRARAARSLLPVLQSLGRTATLPVKPS